MDEKGWVGSRSEVYAGWSGVVCWLYTMATLAVYTFLSDMYEDQQRNLPLYDLGRDIDAPRVQLLLSSPVLESTVQGG